MRLITVQRHEKPISCLKINYDGDLVFSGSPDQTVKMWNTQNGEKLGVFECISAVKSLDLKKDSSLIFVGLTDTTIQVFRISDGQCLGSIRALSGRMKYLELSYSEKFLLCVIDGYEGNFTGSQIFILKIEELLRNIDSTNKKTFQSDSNMIYQQFSFKGISITQCMWGFLDEYLLIGDEKGKLIKSQINGNIILEVQAHEKIRGLQKSQNLEMVVTCGNDGCKVFDPSDLQLLRVFKQDFPMNAASISPLINKSRNPKFHIIMGGGISALETAMTKNVGIEIHLCNLALEEEIGKMGGHFGPVNQLEFCKDGKSFISGSQEGLIRIFKFDENYMDNPAYE